MDFEALLETHQTGPAGAAALAVLPAGHRQQQQPQQPQQRQRSSGVVDAVVEESPGCFKFRELFGSYPKWDEIAWKSPVSGSVLVTFEAKGKDNVVVALADSPKDSGDMYEIVIGGWNNTKSVIRTKAQGPERALSTKSPLCSEGEFLKYWAMLSNEVVSVGVGEEPGKGVVLAWKDSQPMSCQYVSFTSWDNTVVYRNIEVKKVSEGMDIEDDFDLERFVPPFLRKIEDERRRQRERAERFGTEYIEPDANTVAKSVLNVQELAQMKSFSRGDARGGFVTGFDPNSQEEREKAAKRAERFGMTAPTSTSESSAAEEEEKRRQMEARAKRFDIPVIEDLVMVQGVVRDLTGLRVPRRDPDSEEVSRPEALHLYGSFDNVYTEDIMQYFSLFGASHPEWLHDCGVNMVFSDESTAKRAFNNIAKQLPLVKGYEEQINELREKGYFTAPFPLRDRAGMRFFLIRQAHVADIKADKDSGFRTNIGYRPRKNFKRKRRGPGDRMDLDEGYDYKRTKS